MGRKVRFLEAQKAHSRLEKENTHKLGAIVVVALAGIRGAAKLVRPSEREEEVLEVADRGLPC